MARKKPPPPNGPAFCREYVYAASRDALFSRKTRCWISVRAAGALHDHEVGDGDTVRSVMFKGPNAVDKVAGVTFFPGQPELVEEDGGLKLNLWVPPTLVPQPGDAWPFLQLVSGLVDDDPVALGYVLDYLAHLVQRPGLKIQSALLFIGPQGTGKSILGQIAAELVGPMNTRSLSAGDLTSAFNAWIEGSSLIIVDELVNDNSRATAARLKNFITGAWVEVNQKGVAMYKSRNRAHFILLSNDANAATIDDDDRRYFVWVSKRKPRRASFYRWLCLWLARGGHGRILHLLMSRDISRFSHVAKPPRTASHAQVAGYGLSETETYLANALEAVEVPFVCDLVVINHVCEYLNQFGRMRVAPKLLGRLLRSAGAEELGQKRLGAAKPRIWAIRNVERWKNASEDEIARAYRLPNDATRDVPMSLPPQVRRLRSANDR